MSWSRKTAIHLFVSNCSNARSHEPKWLSCALSTRLCLLSNQNPPPASPKPIHQTMFRIWNQFCNSCISSHKYRLIRQRNDDSSGFIILPKARIAYQLQRCDCLHAMDFNKPTLDVRNDTFDEAGTTPRVCFHLNLKQHLLQILKKASQSKRLRICQPTEINRHIHRCDERNYSESSQALHAKC